MKYKATIGLDIEAEGELEAQEIAIQAAAQVYTRLGNGPHSLAPYLTAILGDARILEAEFLNLKENND